MDRRLLVPKEKGPEVEASEPYDLLPSPMGSHLVGSIECLQELHYQLINDGKSSKSGESFGESATESRFLRWRSKAGSKIAS
jgi:hypothetical protein